ncbi:bifunctional 4-hydroxy-2-oxoglutarate aldolase/2-dehydro-3-deoxy-phosphogluconate aldolase [Mucilaginibacter sp. E4BP6]|uniref:bifunctional 4-hydroxy-2-oxoglutarate aldolase/2-dehydro-3-deoxy-phosphogluconate aldolase n=1 Tax=Mucilaginibacter sp. E4BP6 TaxID=2723089 RepID=UPI0015C8117D|nr:bifunctional 4-hydroxy-2-oxoglutarate aldolase/2-dehydro-3-deoxy-phosphogluconate aldolase [Mucilaginibacter sp. E4BP6]NYE65741.1 2-dehydro-3-deoxyphosphogluconate aldolase/(4S)-4-hydroxy-2-oxoglutarate aldolase [Mucilaginibacter sp. E4BP6]
MSTNQDIVKSIITQGMLPLFFHADAEVSLQVTRSLYKAGVRVIEYTNRGPAALENFKLLKKARQKEMPELALGIGTIKTEAEAIDFIDAGADFIVAPIVNPTVAKVAHDNGLLWCPGCMTPTEIFLAQQHGAALIKLFPANILGHSFLSSIKELFPGQLFMPTGGVELNTENISQWFKAGVCAVGLGSKLITKNVLEQGLYEQLFTDTQKALHLVKISR